MWLLGPQSGTVRTAGVDSRYYDYYIDTGSMILKIAPTHNRGAAAQKESPVCGCPGRTEKI